jgi:hypothetical protein
MATGSKHIRVNLEVPKSWEELSQEQLKYYYFVLTMCQSAAEVKTYCLCRWSGLEVLYPFGTGFMCRHEGREFLLKPQQVAAAIQSLDWTDTLPTRPVRLERIGKYRALPADFQEVPFETFIICDNLYQGYLSAKADQLLDDLALVLYQSAKVKPDPAERVGVFYWFASLKEMFAHQFNHFFQPLMTQNNGNMFDQGKSQYEIIYHAVNSQIRALTKGDVTKEKDVLAIDTWRALTELDALAKEYDDFNKKYPNK